MCLGIALASGAPVFSGVLAGIVGGVLVGLLSGSQVSVSAPTAGLTAIVAAQISALGSFQTFLLAVVIAGLIQTILGLARAGFIAHIFPSSVIKGLLAAIGIILILKQIPHILGHDLDPEGEMAFLQPDRQNTFSELAQLTADFHPGAAVIGLASLVLLFVWDRVQSLKKSIISGPLIVVAVGLLLSLFFRQIGGSWSIEAGHRIQVPVVEDLSGLFGLLQWPDFTQWANAGVYRAAVLIAVVASLESLLNLEAIDMIDPQQRTSPPSRELVAQGLGNMVSGLIGGIPITTVIVRSTLNMNTGGQSKRATIYHGLLLIVSVSLLPTWLNLIPLSCIAAILLHTGVKLASPLMFKKIWREGRYQFVPFLLTTACIVFTDLFIGVLLGLATSISFILWSNTRQPLRRIIEKRLGGEVLRIELANQVSFLNRVVLSQVLDEIPRGGHVLLDAANTDYIDPDVLGLIRDFHEKTAPARGIKVSLVGFRNQEDLHDQILYIDYSTRELQSSLTPRHVLQILKDGNERFRSGRRLSRDLGREVQATATGQHPLAVVLSCIDSRSPAELIFDLGVGDVFNVRIAGNVISPKVLGSVEYASAVAGAKLIVIMGHTRCGAVTAAFDLFHSKNSVAEDTGCQHLGPIVRDIQESITVDSSHQPNQLSGIEKESMVNALACRNVLRSVELMRHQSETLDQLVRDKRIAIIGAMYDVVTGDILFLPDHETGDKLDE
jgi:carbonic anhydrase/SulP family sulfate permease